MISFEELGQIFGSAGMLASHLKGYEQRAEQQQMAFAVAEAINENRVALIEAGTGTGKSLAYLIPALLWAVGNDQRVVISTNTINLQEQLIKKDIPLLQRHAETEFTACLVKGRSNYLCRRKLEAAMDEPALFPDAATEEIEAVSAWSGNTRSGCLSDLPFHPSKEIWADLCCESDQCIRSRCAEFGSCYFYKARREAASARLLVVNHALLLADIALRRDSGYEATAILPPFSRLIIDEAHHLEEAATGAMSVRINRFTLIRQLTRLASVSGKAGILAALSNRISHELPEELDGIYQEMTGLIETLLIPQAFEAASLVDKELDWLAHSLTGILSENMPQHKVEQKQRITAEFRKTVFWQELRGRLDLLREKLAELADGLGALDRAAAKLPEQIKQKLDILLVDASGIGQRLSSTCREIEWFTADDADSCRWLETRQSGRNTGQASICVSPLDVAVSLKNSLFDPIATVILTSATLAVGENFNFIRSRTGLDLIDPQRCTELALASPFNYAEQSLIGIINNMPDPSSTAFRRPLAETVLQAVTLSKGGAFVLFTSFELLRQTCNVIKRQIEQQGITVLSQGDGGSRHQLLSRFRKEQPAVLFGTDSFWEGVDVKGDALRLVVITRLPFQAPNEPVQQARAERISASGGDPFLEMSVPQAVLKLRQGFGRLIRSSADRGAVLILDSRTVTRGYGRKFLRSLPEESLVAAGSEELLGRLEDFFRNYR